MEIVKKAWKISINDLVEPYYYEDVIVHAETRDKAKSLGLTEMFNLGAEIMLTDWLGTRSSKDITYTDIKAHRCKEEDLVFYGLKVVNRSRVKELTWCEARDLEAKKIMEEHPDGVAVVYAGIYRSYWGFNHCGYNSDIAGAGKYSTEEAYKIVKGSDYSRQEKVVLLDKDIYNKEIDSRIEEFKKKVETLEGKKLA